MLLGTGRRVDFCRSWGHIAVQYLGVTWVPLLHQYCTCEFSLCTCTCLGVPLYVTLKRGVFLFSLSCNKGIIMCQLPVVERERERRRESERERESYKFVRFIIRL